MEALISGGRMLSLLHCVTKSFIRRSWGFHPVRSRGAGAMGWMHLMNDGAGALALGVVGT
ncbi:hypothetical protein [Thauera sp. WH-1]|uniref:hypothetical protein n=1 Tax=Thauera sp. WH-1 TaxID=3398230 RepID=UPI0039FCDF9D